MLVFNFIKRGLAQDWDCPKEIEPQTLYNFYHEQLLK